MNTHHKRRYVFIDFENLQKVKFKKLEKVCDRVFILIDAAEKSIPFSLVRQIQKLGKAVKWIPIKNPDDGDLNYHLSFVLGKLHQKTDKAVEFAILSNNRSFDPLVNFINESGRTCLRVKNRKPQKPVQFKQKEVNKIGENKRKVTDINPKPFEIESTIDKELINETASDTIQRLIRSGNRPTEVTMLRNYILLHNQELTDHGKVDKIIESLRKNKNIAIREGQVTYNF